MNAVALYLRVSTASQTVENQRLELQRYCDARGWEIVREYADEGISGTAPRPALQKLMADARRRRFRSVVVFRLDRVGRSLTDLVQTLEELHSLGIGFVSLGEGIDFGSSAGRLQLHILAALAQWERERIRERTLAGLERARSQGKRLGRPVEPLPVAKLQAVAGMSLRAGAAHLGVPKSTLQRWRTLDSKSGLPPR